MSSHDVRRITACHDCRTIEFKENLIPVMRDSKDVFMCGKCFVAKWGEADFLSLRPEFTKGIRLSDVGPELMKKWLDKHAQS